ncbi:MAG: endonuclease III [Oscillospiraceae bacterium]|nr:endonuclease III [Oscillospiraceae bacterium]
MQPKTRALHLIACLEQTYPEALCSLQYPKDYELLFTVRLAAQCTDERVNQIAPALFARFPTLESFAEGPVEDVERLVHSTGFYRAKARDIVAAAQMLITQFNSKVPDNMNDLLKLPGVGRKTANLILGDIYKTPGSVVVDTHCIRITNRMGLVDTKDPAKIETELRKILPPDKSNDFCHRLVLHGRAVCTARKPHCDLCSCAPYCKHFTG